MPVVGQFIVLTVLDILILVYVETALKKRLLFFILSMRVHRILVLVQKSTFGRWAGLALKHGWRVLVEYDQVNGV